MNTSSIESIAIPTRCSSTVRASASSTFPFTRASSMASTMWTFADSRDAKKRPRISPAAFLVNVIAARFRASVPPRTSATMRSTSTVVFPDPAPARTTMLTSSRNASSEARGAVMLRSPLAARLLCSSLRFTILNSIIAPQFLLCIMPAIEQFILWRGRRRLAHF